MNDVMFGLDMYKSLLFVCLVVFYVPSTARSFRDGYMSLTLMLFN